MDGYNVLTIILAFGLSFFSIDKLLVFVIGEPFKTFFSAVATAVAALLIKYLVEPLFLSLQKKIFKKKE